MVGVLFVATCAYLSAVFLVSDARRAGSDDLERYFTTRALASGLATGALAVAGIVVLHSDAHYLYDGLTHEGLPLVICQRSAGSGWSCCSAGAPAGAPVHSPWARWWPWSGAGAWRSTRTCFPRSSRSPTAPRRARRSRRS